MSGVVKPRMKLQALDVRARAQGDLIWLAQRRALLLGAKEQGSCTIVSEQF